MNNRLALFFMGLFSLLFISACQTPAMTEEQNNANSASKSVEMLAKNALQKAVDTPKKVAYKHIDVYSSFQMQENLVATTLSVKANVPIRILLLRLARQT